MKKTFLFLLIAITFFAITGHAQTEKGKKMIGGQFILSGNNSSYLDSVNHNKSTLFTFQILPQIGYFVKDNLAVGIMLNFGLSNSNQGYSNSFSTSFSNLESRSIMYGGGGFIRCYKKIVEKFSFFVNGSSYYNHGNSSISNFSNSVRIDAINFHIIPGLVYFPSPKFGIEATFGDLFYNYSSSKTLNSSRHGRGNNYGINLRPSSLFLGMNYYF